MLYEIIPRGYPFRDKCLLRSSKGDYSRQGDEQIRGQKCADEVKLL